jgi:hypothetical protein
LFDFIQYLPPSLWGLIILDLAYLGYRIAVSRRTRKFQHCEALHNVKGQLPGDEKFPVVPYDLTVNPRNVVDVMALLLKRDLKPQLSRVKEEYHIKIESEKELSFEILKSQGRVVAVT